MQPTAPERAHAYQWLTTSVHSDKKGQEPNKLDSALVAKPSRLMKRFNARLGDLDHAAGKTRQAVEAITCCTRNPKHLQIGTP